jgi:hypothetical protein
MQIIFVPVVSAAPPTFSGGDGTSGTPYLISSCNDLYGVDYSDTFLAAEYSLTQDLDCSGMEYGNNVMINKYYDGESDYYFAGFFNGNGYTITVAFTGVEQTEPMGLFQYSDGGSFEDLHVAGTVTSDGDKVGGLLGHDLGGTYLSLSSSSAVVNGNNNVGGLIGYSDGSAEIGGSYSTGNVTGIDNVGGLIGSAVGVSVSSILDEEENTLYSYATGTVTGNDNVGGLIGTLADSSGLEECYATGDVSGIYYIGGLVGYSTDSDVMSCYATGDVEAESYGGGLAGYFSGGQLESSYAEGQVTGTLENIGGLVGSVSNSQLVSTYATGDVEGTDYVGGLLGAGDNNSIASSFATGHVTGNDNVGGFAGYSNCCTVYNEIFALGDVMGIDNVGGLFGFLYEDVIGNAYARGDVEGTSYVGGIIGNNDYSDGFFNVYFSGNVSGSEYVGGLIGGGDDDAAIVASFWEENDNPEFSNGEHLDAYDDEYSSAISTSALKDINTYNFEALGLSHWCFAEMECETIWALDSEAGLINNGYPYFGWAEEFLANLDTTGPEITLLNVVETADGAVITWEVNETGTTHIEYGLTSGALTDELEPVGEYEADSDIEDVLADLEACTTYYFKIEAIDEEGNETMSEEFSFKTLGCSSGGSSSSSGSRVARTNTDVDSSSEKFTDIDGHWAEEYIDDIAEKCKIEGYKDENGNVLKKFGPDDEMLRAEFVEILTQCRFPELPVPTVKPFPDVEISNWFAPALEKGKSLGWIHGYKEDGYFRPLITISRAEATKILMLSEFSESELEDIQPNFTDMPASANLWYAKYVANAVKKGYLEGYASGAFGGDDTLLRGQAAKIISKLMVSYNN